MSDYNDKTIFDGQSGFTSGAFLRSVRQIIMANNQYDDDQWAAQYAATRLDGQALQWYEQQDGDTQESWKLLRRRILERWPPAQEVAAPGSASVESSNTPETIPTPAAAPPPAASSRPLPAPPPQNSDPYAVVRQWTSFPSSSYPIPVIPSLPLSTPSYYRARSPPEPVGNPLPKGWIKGNIEVISMSKRSYGYISRSVNDLGYPLISKAPGKELIVTFRTSFLHHQLEITGGEVQQYLAIVWTTESVFSKATRQGSSRGCLVTATRSDSGKVVALTTEPNASAKTVPPFLDVWHILVDGTVVIAKEEKPRIRRALIPMMNKDKTISFGPSAAEFMVGEDALKWEEVKLVFEVTESQM